MTRSSEHLVWHGAAFGLNLTGDFPAPGLADRAAGGSRTPETAIALVEHRALDPGPATVLYQHPLPEGTFSIGQHRSGWYVADHPFYGRYGVAADAGRIECAPEDLPDWLWQRFLVGQILPLAALLHGREPLHASGVVLDGGAVLLMGASGAGKSSVALQLAARSGTFLADDVSALEVSSGGVLAHPGAALVSLEAKEIERVPACVRLKRLGESDGEVRLQVAARARRPVPVRSVYVLNRRAHADKLRILPREQDGPRLLLGATFNAYLRTPERLARQLDVCAGLADSASLREVSIPPRSNAADVARAIEADAS